MLLLLDTIHHSMCLWIPAKLRADAVASVPRHRLCRTRDMDRHDVEKVDGIHESVGIVFDIVKGTLYRAKLKYKVFETQVCLAE